jgi:effector-binding domain-containing protein
MTVTAVPEVKVVEREEQPTLAVRTRADVRVVPLLVPELIEEVHAYLRTLGEAPTGPPYGRYDGPDEHGTMALEVGWPTALPLPTRGRVERHTLPAGRWAETVHLGPYQELDEHFFAALEARVRAQGLEPAGPPVEVWESDPRVGPPGEIRTTLLVPVR